MGPLIHHLHTYFLFPFSVDKEAVLEDHREFWLNRKTWFDGLDEWIDYATRREQPQIALKIGPWRRAAYTRFDLDSEAYQTMVFFHPFVRRVFFDAHDRTVHGSHTESLLNCYSIDLAGKRVLIRAEDFKGKITEVQVTDLRLFLFANGIGILSIGVEAFDIPADEALWINEMLRKVYPSSARQIREGRIPRCVQILLRGGPEDDIVVEERFEQGGLVNFHARLANTISELLYFADYAKHEYAAVLDERMLVYTYVAVDRSSVPEEFETSEDLKIMLSRLLYVDRWGPDYRYNPRFTRRAMRRQLYDRWAHQGTYYGSSSYSNITLALGEFDCDDHSLAEGFLIHRMFESRYYLMCVIALFYRATLLDFSERAALVSKRLYIDQADDQLTPESIHIANRLRADFLHFTNYWFFDELANKDEEMEHFLLQCRQYRLWSMKSQTEAEIEKLNTSLTEYYETQSATAVNRLAVSSIVLGAGAVFTGYFGMNFAREFGAIFFDASGVPALWHYLAIGAVTIFAIAAVALAFYLIIANWQDYRHILLPNRRTDADMQSLRRGALAKPEPRKAEWTVRRKASSRIADVAKVPQK